MYTWDHVHVSNVDSVLIHKSEVCSRGRLDSLLHGKPPLYSTNGVSASTVRFFRINFHYNTSYRIFSQKRWILEQFVWNVINNFDKKVDSTPDAWDLLLPKEKKEEEKRRTEKKGRDQTMINYTLPNPSPVLEQSILFQLERFWGRMRRNGESGVRMVVGKTKNPSTHLEEQMQWKF